ncbi:CGNR zinc finger domain-containing protein [Amycolatopsis nigrescens]|uniref:CGNR zinc finger domain-containing protein n=1 Tax=Amycolatopsis nigrescens TaxID=381445 RepID=UPI0003678E21|nr:CGNR zinc finger domain-containing protein [Amycolatopsis nigrescens]
MTARQLTGPDGERYSFDPGAFCLELLLTGDPELLTEAGALAEWLAGSRLALSGPLAAEDFRIRPAELDRIRDFRGSMRSAANRLAAGKRPRSGELTLINDSAGATLRPRLVPNSGARGWATPITGVQVLGAAARDAIELIGGPSASRVRRCEGDGCKLVFLDTSRPGNRRWCSMQRCGNRHKVSAYRTRHQAR